MFRAYRARWSSPALFAGIVLTFLLPFGTVSCSGEQVTFTGGELALFQVPTDATDYEGDDASLAETVEGEAGVPAFVALAAALVGFGLGLAGRRGGGVAAAVGLSAMLLLAWKAVTSLATVYVHAGYVLALVGFGTVASYHALAARRRRRSVVAGEPGKPRPRWRRGVTVAAPVLLALLVLLAGWGALHGTTAEDEPEYVDFDTADYDPAWAPDGREIAFVRRGAVHTVAADGSCPRRVTEGTEPAWSPDGTRLAVTRCDGDVCSVMVVSRDGSTERELVAGPFSSPAWAPDGAHVYMSRAEDDLTTTTWIVRTDGKELRRLAPPWLPRRDRRWSIAAASEDAPTLSPDGSRYAFASSGDSTAGIDALHEAIFVRDVRGGERRQLSDPPGNAGDYDPAWAPDGTRISFQRSGEIAVMDADGSNERVLTNVNGATSSAWSPGGRELVFTRELYGGTGSFSDPSALIVIEIESRRTRKLTWGDEPVAGCERRG